MGVSWTGPEIFAVIIVILFLAWVSWAWWDSDKQAERRRIERKFKL